MTGTIGISESRSEGYTKKLIVYLKAKLVPRQFYGKTDFVEAD